MRSTKPGVAMPELGRQLAHESALEVLSDWIRSLPGSYEPSVPQPAQYAGRGVLVVLVTADVAAAEQRVGAHRLDDGFAPWFQVPTNR